MDGRGTVPSVVWPAARGARGLVMVVVEGVFGRRLRLCDLLVLELSRGGGAE